MAGNLSAMSAIIYKTNNAGKLTICWQPSTKQTRLTICRQLSANQKKPDKHQQQSKKNNPSATICKTNKAVNNYQNKYNKVGDTTTYTTLTCLISSSVGSSPSVFMTVPNSLQPMDPSPFLSKTLNASRYSAICSGPSLSTIV